jgi:hypothetical protein
MTHQTRTARLTRGDSLAQLPDRRGIPCVPGENGRYIKI